jgi:creatinine amidohydrolase
VIIEDMTMPEFVAGLEKTRTVFIPFGSTEEHGSHLPLSTDTLQAVSVGRRLAERRPLFVAPSVAYGVCRSTSRHPGTLSITTGTLKALTCDIVASLYGHGLRNFILLTGHAGGTHNAALIDAGESLLERFPDLKIAVLTEYQLAAGEGRGLIETVGDSHAGEIETSRMLYSHPHLVKGGKRISVFSHGDAGEKQAKVLARRCLGGPYQGNGRKGSENRTTGGGCAGKVCDKV